MEETLNAIFQSVRTHLENENISALRESYEELKWTMHCLLAIERQESAGKACKRSGLYQMNPYGIDIQETNKGLNP